MSPQQQIVSALETFNNSDYRRTMAGIARSLGEPAVSIQPIGSRPGQVSIVIAWELCWYRYEVDLSDELPGVRVAAQGYELDELQPEQRRPNVAYDEHGALVAPRR